MGIKKLFTFLNDNNLYKIYPYLNDLINDMDIDKKQLIVGVDGNLFCYKYTYSYDNMLIGFFNQILKFLSNKIIPLYIFDGGTLKEKDNTNLLRYQKKIVSKHKLEQIENLLEINMDVKEKNELLILKKKFEKNSTKISNLVSIVLELFDLLNIPYIFSYGEGEYLAVLLSKYNVIDFFLTDDTDPIPAGINHIIKFYNNNVYYLNVELSLKKLKLSKDQFCDFCILLGSDYATFNHSLKPNELYDLIVEHKTIENIYKNNKIYCLDDSSFTLINKLRNIYKYSIFFERELFISKKNNFNSNQNNKSNSSINSIIDHSNFCFYSNIILEFWDNFIELLSVDLINLKDIKNNNDNSEITNNNDNNELTNNNNNSNIDNIKMIKNNGNNFKMNICNFVSKSKFNIKNIIKFIKNNVKDITEEEICNMVLSFEFLNTFGI